MPPVTFSRNTDSLMRFAALMLPLAFFLMQLNSTHRVSAPTLKLSVKVVACCAVAAVAFAMTMSSNSELVVCDQTFCTSTRRGGSFLKQAYRASKLQQLSSSAGVTLERNRVRFITDRSAIGLDGDDDVLDEALREWLESDHFKQSAVSQRSSLKSSRQSVSTQPLDNNKMDDVLQEALAEIMQRCPTPRSASTPLVSCPHTPEGACTPSTPDFAHCQELSAASSMRVAGPLSSSRRASSDISDIASATSSSSPRSTVSPLLGEVTKKWRHNPYSFRAYSLLDVGANCHTVPIEIRNGDVSVTHDVRLDVLLKPSQPPIDLRRRGKISGAAAVSTGDAAKVPTPKAIAPAAATPAAAATSEAPAAKSTTDNATARASNPDAAVARKNFKKACEAIKLPVDEPLYTVVVKLPTVVEPVPERWQPTIDEGWTTLTGLPNADGHRVAEALLKHYAKVGVVRGNYSLSNDVRRMDRFNTGACHVLFSDTEDAQRLQMQLRHDMVFAAFREGRCVVSSAME